MGHVLADRVETYESILKQIRDDGWWYKANKVKGGTYGSSGLPSEVDGMISLASLTLTVIYRAFLSARRKSREVVYMYVPWRISSCRVAVSKSPRPPGGFWIGPLAPPLSRPVFARVVFPWPGFCSRNDYGLAAV